MDIFGNYTCIVIEYKINNLKENTAHFKWCKLDFHSGYFLSLITLTSSLHYFTLGK